MEAFAIEGTLRTDLGKSATRTLRRDGNIPCELYGGEDNLHFYTSTKAVKDMIYTPNLYKAELHVGGKTYGAIIKDIQFHPVTDEILHIDFQELVPGRTVQTAVPIRTVGVPAGVRTGGKLMLKVRKLRIKATPETLLDKVEIDVSKLKLGQSFKVRDIPETGMTILNSPSIPIASVDIPRALRGGGIADDEEEEDAEGEGSEGEGATEETTSAEA